MYEDGRGISSERDNDLTGRLIEQYKALQKERNHLKEQLEKVKITSETEMSICKEQNKNLLLENSMLSRSNRDLRTEIQNLEMKIRVKEKEIKELQTRFEMKGAIDQKHSERDLNLFKSMLGRGATVTNSYDAKILSIIRTFENQVQDIEAENKELKRMAEELKKREADYEYSRKTLNKDREFLQDKFSIELRDRINELAAENSALLRDYEQQRDGIGELNQVISQLKLENTELRQLYDDFKKESRKNNPVENSSSSKKDAELPPKGKQNYNPEASQNKFEIARNNDNEKNITLASNSKEMTEQTNYSFRAFTELSELTIIECRKILSEVNLLSIDSSFFQNLVDFLAIRQAERAIQAIPRMQKFLSEITGVILETIGLPNDFQHADQVIPTLKRWIIELNQRESLMSFRGKCIEVLEIPDDSSDKDIISKIEEASFLSKDTQKKEKENTRGESENKVLLSTFTQMFGVQPTISTFKDILNQLNDINHFLSIIKSKLNLSPNMRNEACLTYILKYLDYAQETKDSSETLKGIQKMLNVPYNQILSTIEQ